MEKSYRVFNASILLRVHLKVILENLSIIFNTWMIKKFQVIEILKTLPRITTF